MKFFEEQDQFRVHQKALWKANGSDTLFGISTVQLKIGTVSQII
jgi:hypothetical protein